jgi:sec-independent protein translocase protein TatA
MFLGKTLLLLSLPSGMEWIWIVLVVIILFGGKKIPELAKGIGKGIRDFNDAKDGVKKEIESGINESSSTNAGNINQAKKLPENQ